MKRRATPAGAAWLLLAAVAVAALALADRVSAHAIAPGNQPLSKACFPTFSWDKADCENLNRRLERHECPVDVEVWPYHVVWLGSGCPSPCAVLAEKEGKDAQVFCKRVGMYPRFQDGGTSLRGAGWLGPATDPASPRARRLPTQRHVHDALRGGVREAARVRVVGGGRLPHLRAQGSGRVRWWTASRRSSILVSSFGAPASPCNRRAQLGIQRNSGSVVRHAVWSVDRPLTAARSFAW